MSERLFSPAVYVIVWAVLVLLTIANVALSFAPSTGMTRLITGESIAVVEAALVVLFLMHVLRSTAQIRTVIVISVFWLAAILLGLTFSDYITRGIIPNLLGH